MLARSSALAEATSSAIDALSAKGKSATVSKNQFICTIHGKNSSHDSKDCHALKAAAEKL